MSEKPKSRLEDDRWVWLGIFAIDIAATLAVGALFLFVTWNVT
jgi:hypothetical protein